ncbi:MULTISPECIES: DUF2069 domain-containing protein [unclassified Oleiphilus]|jgi:uncharacterized membrane protein|uniref:DUF2069 domain-containing protein n=2 Tax=Oleiphilus TaxID=141450 RepID=UPI0007C20A39|nr:MULTISPECIES: DUF2069 domain-containing protein [unclassified Oleiphilus]KZY42598.1 hypothetical protein A3732_02420 [Oleiphilus sp. HI0050]KZY75648.1 hypothetical protein A3740_14900 [Oleiphilus sp. HI0068]KZY80616.1 hypothetical protein A3741_05385 [Oleiphilus sp. HI0069]KZY88311.1 hypothetical protein A3743_12060 [Oleiphilus sp. HI0072]KZZ17107.1 hypothetical protein A3749_04290 [Oleiphilus sp. HI0078]KZZ29621.1 hypothetical protein A3752_03120 [Oleiphilus sp. HI0081]KZZ35774.1 hypothe
MSQTPQRPRKNVVAYCITWASYLLLILMMIITSLPSYLPEGSSPWVVVSVKLSPLLIILPGLIKDSLRSYTWLCFIVLFYFTQAVVEAFLSQGAGLDLVITLLTVNIFLSAMFYIKWERALGRALF